MENSDYNALAATRDVARGIRIVFGISIRIPVFVANTAPSHKKQAVYISRMGATLRPICHQQSIILSQIRVGRLKILKFMALSYLMLRIYTMLD